MNPIVSHAIFTFIGTCLGMVPGYYLLRRKLISSHQIILKHLGIYNTEEYNAPLLRILQRTSNEIAILKIDVMELKSKLKERNGEETKLNEMERNEQIK